MYRHMDGYPSGHGIDLAKFLLSGKIVNGINLGETKSIFNGIECLSASMICHFKNGPGSIYIYHNNIKDAGQNYEYHIIYNYDTNDILLQCFEMGYINNKNMYIYRKRNIFSGSSEEFIKKYDENA